MMILKIEFAKNKGLSTIWSTEKLGLFQQESIR